MADGYLNFDTKINESGFNSGLSKLSSAAKSGLATTVKAVAAVTAALGAGVVAGVKYNASIEQYQTSFEVMTGSAEKAEQIVQRLTKLGAETPFEMPQLAETTQLLMNYGFTADDAMDKMMMLGDISQGSADKMTRIATAYGQMSSAGKVQLEDVKQMIEAGFNPLQEISESTGESMESLYDRISKGTLSVDEITASMQRATSEGGKYFQSMEKQSQTINGQLSTLKDNSMQLLGSLTSGISEALGNNLLPGVINFVDQLNSAFETGGATAVFQTLAATFNDAINSMLVSAQKQGPQIISGITQGIVSAIPGLIAQASVIIQNLMAAITANAPALVSSGVQIISSLISGIGQQLPTLVPMAVQMILVFAQAIISNAPQLISAGLQFIVNLVQGIVSAIPQILSAVPILIQTFMSGLTSSSGNLIAAGIEILAALISGLIEGISQLPMFIIQFFGAFVNGIFEVDWGSIGKQVLEAILDGLTGISGSIVKAVKNLFLGSDTAASEEGRKAGEGYAKGIEGATGTAVSSATEVANSATMSFSSGLAAGAASANMAGLSLGTAASTGLQLSNMPMNFSMNAQNAATGMTNTLNANATMANFAAMTLGNSANSGLQLSNMPMAFSTNAQTAASGVSNTLYANTGAATTAGLSVGNSANTGLSLSNMSGTYSSAGTQAVSVLSGSISGGSGSVAGAASGVGNAAGASLAGSSLTPESTRLGTEAMNGLANAINSSNGTLTSAGTQAANSVLQGLKSPNMAQQARTEGQNFAKSLADAIQAGSGSVRSSASSIANAAINAVNSAGLSSSGYSAGSSFSAGLASGILAGQGGIAAAAAQVAQAAVAAANANLQIHSPSKVAAKIGEMFDAGIGQGLEKHVKLVRNGINTVTGAMSIDTKNALSRLQSRAISGIPIQANSIQGSARQQEAVNYNELLNEWERRQVRLNQQRDDRPIILNSRTINRASRTPGGKIGGAIAIS